jgi:hypothetical protein
MRSSCEQLNDSNSHLEYVITGRAEAALGKTMSYEQEWITANETEHPRCRFKLRVSLNMLRCI